MVPYCNRIDAGRFATSSHVVHLPPNMPGSDHPHPLHGFGWQASWNLVEVSEHHARIAHRYIGGAWPWAYLAEQHFALSPDGLDYRMSIVNQSGEPMPCGLGLHPYLPRDGAIYRGLHRGQWYTGEDGLPNNLELAERPRDWWDGAAVDSRLVDTVYTGREGALSIAWPDRNLELEIAPSAQLPLTAVFVPPECDFFCVEPMSHQTDALNRDPAQMVRLDPGAEFSIQIGFRARDFMRPQTDR